MSVFLSEILKKFPTELELVRGDLNQEIKGLNSPELASDRELIFLSQPQHLKKALLGKSSAWVVQSDLAKSVPENVSTLITSSNPVLAMASIGRAFFPLALFHRTVEGENIHPSAVVAKSAKVGMNVTLGPGAVVGERVTIGDGTVIGSNSVIEPDVVVGSNCHIHPLVFIGHDVILGDRVEILPNSTVGTDGFGYAQDSSVNHHRLVHYGRVVLEDDVHIGAGVQIDRGTYGDTRVGSGTKIDNHCHLGHNVSIGQKTLITGGFIAAGSSSVGSHCVIGGRTTVSGHISIADRTQLGGLSAVNQTIAKAGAYAGFPLQELKESLKTRAIIRDLPRLRSQLRDLIKRVSTLETKSE